MMTTLKITKILIDKVEKVEVEKLPESQDFEFAQRSIIIWTEQGDKYELILEAASSKNLEFREVSDWLEPKVYKGSKEE